MFCKWEWCDWNIPIGPITLTYFIKWNFNKINGRAKEEYFNEKIKTKTKFFLLNFLIKFFTAYNLPLMLDIM